MLNHSKNNMNDRAPFKGKSSLRSTLFVVAALAPMVAMTGCANVSKRHFTVGSVQDSYKTRHPIVIDQKEQTLDIPIASDAIDLPIAQAGAIEGFTHRFKKSAANPITVLMPKGSPNERSAARIGDRIVETIAKSGIGYNQIRTAQYDASQHGSSAPIRLSYVAVAANTAECGKWPEDLAGANVQNKNFHNFGCASQGNFAAMVANPSDLIAPRGMTEIDSERRNEVIKDYREGNTALGADLTSSLAN